jgi:hypothetical protein
MTAVEACGCGVPAAHPSPCLRTKKAATEQQVIAAYEGFCFQYRSP